MDCSYGYVVLDVHAGQKFYMQACSVHGEFLCKPVLVGDRPMRVIRAYVRDHEGSYIEVHPDTRGQAG